MRCCRQILMLISLAMIGLGCGSELKAAINTQNIEPCNLRICCSTPSESTDYSKLRTDCNINSFIILGDKKSKAIEQTYAKIACDENSFYITALCEQKDIEKNIMIYPPESKHDSPIFRDDCLEIFIDTFHNHRIYYHFVVNSAGVLYEAKHIKNIVDKSWNGRWSVKITKSKDAWIAAITIPLSTFVVRPNYMDIWGFNICRHNAAFHEYSTWSFVGNSFHDPTNFGHLVFDDTAFKG
jgi:hypothetical protein